METIKVISPVDGSVYAERPIISESGLDAVIANSKAAQARWMLTSFEERGRYCLKFLDALLGMNDEITPEIAWQMGRPVRYGGEKGGVEARTKFVVENAQAALSSLMVEDSGAFRRYVKHVPLGVVLVIAPWNYPYLTTINTVIPALMAGNSVILKHAAQTLVVGERFAKAFEMAGLPKGLFQNIVMNHAQTEKLLGSGQIDHCNFTGSVAGGRAIEKAAAGTFMTLGLELGGKDPAYVLADANVHAAIETLVDGAFYNSGQCCCGIERIYVHEKVYKEFVDGFVELTKKYKLGNPTDPATNLGPMVRTAAADFVRGQIDEAVKKGAKALIDESLFPRQQERHALSGAASAGRCRPQHERDDGGKLRPRRRHHESEVGRGGAETHERQPLWPHLLHLDERRRRRRENRRGARDRHRVPQPLRLPRSRPALDGREGHGPRRFALGRRVRAPDKAEKLSFEERVRVLKATLENI